MRRVAFAVAFLAIGAAVASADVRTEERSQVKLEGPLGRIMSIFGGKAARDGVVSTVTVKGDRKMTVTDRTAQIVDLEEEKVYELDLSKKTYTVMTFDELRRRAQEAMQQAASEAAKVKDAQRQAPPPEASRADVEFDLKNSGQTRTIDGYEAHEVVMTISVHEKGKPLDQGGMVLTSSTWLAPKVAGSADVAAFDRRFAEKLALPTMIDEQQMAQAMAMYPMLADGMKRLQAENVRLDGTPLLTVVKIEATGAQNTDSSASAKPEKEPAVTPTSLGGFGGALARRALRKKTESAAAPDASTSTPGRLTIMTIQHEVTKITPSVTDADVAIPDGFRQKS